jgi:hypothetical protein
VTDNSNRVVSLTRLPTNSRGLFGKSLSITHNCLFTHQIKNIPTFLHFLYYINHFFIIIQIKKLTTKQKFFHFSIKTFSNFISHQSLFTTIQTNISQHNYLPNTLNVFDFFFLKKKI